MSNCEVVTFPLVSWVRCGAWFYRFLVFALFLTFTLLQQKPLFLKYIWLQTHILPDIYCNIYIIVWCYLDCKQSYACYKRIWPGNVTVIDWLMAPWELNTDSHNLYKVKQPAIFFSTMIAERERASRTKLENNGPKQNSHNQWSNNKVLTIHTAFQ